MELEDKKEQNVLTDEEEQEEINVNISEDEYVSREALLFKIETLERLAKRAEQRINWHQRSLENMKTEKLQTEEKARQALLKMGVNLLMGKRG